MTEKRHGLLFTGMIGSVILPLTLIVVLLFADIGQKSATCAPDTWFCGLTEYTIGAIIGFIFSIVLVYCALLVLRFQNAFLLTLMGLIGSAPSVYPSTAAFHESNIILAALLVIILGLISFSLFNYLLNFKKLRKVTVISLAIPYFFIVYLLCSLLGNLLLYQVA